MRGSREGREDMWCMVWRHDVRGWECRKREGPGNVPAGWGGGAERRRGAGRETMTELLWETGDGKKKEEQGVVKLGLGNR